MYSHFMKDCETRLKIMETAMELMWRSSYDSVGVGAICRQSQTHKGSFYHFFHSKEELAVEALEEHWQNALPQIEAVFSNEKPAIDRILGFCDYTLELQSAKKQELGFVYGCPYATIGLEQCAQSQAIRETSQQILNKIKQFIEDALRIAADYREIEVADVAQKANMLFTLYLGALAQARLSNSLEPIQSLKDQFLDAMNVALVA